MSAQEIALQIKDLEAGFITREGVVKAVDGVSLNIKKGEFLGIAGESGCGKSTLAFSLMKLLEDNGRILAGEILLGDRNLVTMSEDQSRKVRWKNISMVFQSAMNALNPVLNIKDQLVDVQRAHNPDIARKSAINRAIEMLELVDIPADRLESFPHQLSGGMKQRIMIAMALILNPDVIIMDEPTTALDVVVQRTLIEKITDLRDRFQFSVIFITHDLSLLVEISDTLAIMYCGEIVEYGPAEKLYTNPLHPYTRGLMNSFPPLIGDLKSFGGIPGKPPNFLKLPAGCRFNPRCTLTIDPCYEQHPSLEEIETGHHARCFCSGTVA